MRKKGQTTPLMEQYNRIKSQYPDKILFFRMGDFYEMFGKDAEEAAPILGIALTSRAHGKSGKIPLAGIPYHAVERYLDKLIKAGKKVVICEQVEDPKLAKGLVKREVIEVVTPATNIKEETDSPDNNFLLSFLESDDRIGLAYVDYTTGEFWLEETDRENTPERIRLISPREILYPDFVGVDPLKVPEIESFSSSLTPLESWRFTPEFADRILKEHFGVTSLEGFGCQDLNLATRAGGAALSYLEEIKKRTLPHIVKLSRARPKSEMFLDAETIANLELFAGSGFATRGLSLLSVIDRTLTPMGKRLLKRWLSRPLSEVKEISGRQDGVEEFLKEESKRNSLHKALRGFPDLERLASRISVERANARDLISLKLALRSVEALKESISQPSSKIIRSRLDAIPDLKPLIELIEKSIVDEPPLSLTEGGLIKGAFDSELDNLKSEIKDARQYIASLQEIERKKTGISSLKVGYNKVFGYYIEVTKPNLKKVPAHYIRKQTIANGERFITPELKEKEEKILKAEEVIFEREHQIFKDICLKIADRISELQTAASMIAVLDCLSSLAQAAKENRYSRPQVDDSDVISIKSGRHPIVEKALPSGSFVPNNTELSASQPRAGQLHIITGPNMAGKSTYLRQVGLIALLAQMGSFVPAKSARIGIVDRIFTRVGAQDEIAAGRSTFLIEMNETANILNNASPKSLILLDEVGRGTSTFDGLAIAWAVTEFIHNRPELGSRTLFATHYHQLTQLADALPRVKNFQAAVRETEDEVTFLRKIIPGGCDDSYGIYVAKLAGVPKEVILRSQEVLIELEAKHPININVTAKRTTPKFLGQLSLFSSEEERVLKELKEVDSDKLTPLQALKKLAGLKEKLQAGD
jgi:DNA mismatch repair protein MutS